MTHTAAAAASAPIVHAVRPIAGVPLEHRVADGIAIRSPDTEGWSGSPAAGEAVVLEHVIGACSVESMRLVMEAPPWSAYFADGADRVSTLFREVAPSIPARLLRTIEPGTRYELRYARRPAVAVEQRDAELALFTIVLAERRMGLLAHGCGYVLPDGRAVLSPGMSGAGKSTLARLLARAGDAAVLNDDRVVITDERAGHGFRAWGSPWPGQGGMARALDAPLGALAFIRHAGACALRSVTPRDAARRLYRMLALPLWNGHATADALECVDRIVTELPLLELAFPPAGSSARWIVRVLMERTRDA